MFFFASKTLDLLVDPLWWVVICAGIAFLLGRSQKRRRAAWGWALGGLAVFLLASTPLVANGLKWSLEQGNVPLTIDAAHTWDAVVLLGGVVDFAGATGDEAAWNGNVERLITVYDLLRTGRARRAILSGGVGAVGLPTEAEFLQRQLLAWGIEAERLEIEPKALNTRDNALFSKARLDAHGDRSVLVVTSASHTARARGCFRAVGLEVDMLAVDYRMRDPWAHHQWVPRSEYLGETSRSLREYLGRFIYRLLGYSKDSLSERVVPKSSGHM